MGQGSSKNKESLPREKSAKDEKTSTKEEKKDNAFLEKIDKWFHKDREREKIKHGPSLNTKYSVQSYSSFDAIVGNADKDLASSMRLKQKISRANLAFYDKPNDKCPGCGGAYDETQKFVVALKKTWHPDCFKCAICAETLTALDYHTLHEGKVMCEDCFLEKEGLKCDKCKEIIEIGEPCAKVLDYVFHVRHFQCEECNTPLENKQVFEVEGKLYCDVDYHIKFGHQCRACKEVIHGEFVQAEKYYFHKEHFICSVCDRELNENYIYHQGKYFCDKDRPALSKEERPKLEDGGLVVKIKD